MSILNEMMTEDTQQQSSEMLQSLMSKSDANEQQLAMLTKKIGDLMSYVKVMDDETNKRLDRISQQPAQPSLSTTSDAKTSGQLLPLVTQIANAVAGEEFTKGLSLLNESGKKMTEATATAAKAQKAAADENAETLRKLNNTLRHFETKAADKLQEVATRSAAGASAEVGARLDASNARADRLMKTAEKLEAKAGWMQLGRLAGAAIPFALIGLFLLALITPIVHILGLGQLYTWAWEVVWNEELAWWLRVLMVLGTLASLVGIYWLAWKQSRRWVDWYRGW